MAYLDAPEEFQGGAAAGAGVGGGNLPQVGILPDGNVPVQIDAGVVVVVGVGAGRQVGQAPEALIGIEGQLQADGASKADAGAGLPAPRTRTAMTP